MFVCRGEVCRGYQRHVPPDLRDVSVDDRRVFAGHWLDPLRDMPGIGYRLLRQAAVSAVVSKI